MHVHATLTHMHAHAILRNMHLHDTMTTHAFRKHPYYFEDILLLASAIPKQLRPQEMIHLHILTNTSLAYVTSCIHERHELFHQHKTMSHPYGGSTSTNLHATVIPNRQ